MSLSAAECGEEGRPAIDRAGRTCDDLEDELVRKMQHCDELGDERGEVTKHVCSVDKGIALQRLYHRSVVKGSIAPRWRSVGRYR